MRAPMPLIRTVCPWQCSGLKGEVNLVGPERTLVPNVGANAPLMRCQECQGISLATVEMVQSPGAHRIWQTEYRTPLGRFEGTRWMPAASDISRIAIPLVKPVAPLALAALLHRPWPP